MVRYSPENSTVRLRLQVIGMVQGVGFRPFVHRLATALALNGWVRNSSAGVTIEVEGGAAAIREFSRRLREETPLPAILHDIEEAVLPPLRDVSFEIRPSRQDEAAAPYVLPDLALCAECLRELRDPSDRRFRHPFITCTHCGPRYSILLRLPYDRPNTSMHPFPMCAACRAEYQNPSNRRFHAQPIACPDCGPHLAWWNQQGQELATREPALLAAAEAVRSGAVVAIKGLGGFHLVVNATDAAAVRRLRDRKRRAAKPFALMVPDLTCARSLCRVDGEEERLLQSAAAPIVLLDRAPGGSVVDQAVAPGLDGLGLMLPYTPLHHLLLAELGFPVVATSGNRAEEPLCTDEREALRDLRRIADFFLVHDRPIARPIDDSVVRVVDGRPLVLRRARGLAPVPIPLRIQVPPLLALGAHQKNTVALGLGNAAVISPHIGDLETEKSLAAFEAAQRDLQALFEFQPARLACDMHPDYVSTRRARESGLPWIMVQHHHAHIVSCMAENALSGEVLGVAWDGTGFGPDGTVWGGEFLLADEAAFTRVASLRLFPLPGGDQAVREPRRVAWALLHECGLLKRAEALRLDAVCSFSETERKVLARMVQGSLNTPRTSSMGRLFDGVSALLGLCQRARFEGEGAMRLEAAVRTTGEARAYPFGIAEQEEGRVARVDWAPMLAAILDDLEAGRPASVIAAVFHATLASVIVSAARRTGCPRVVLSGGCFQNRRLLEQALVQGRNAGFEVFTHQRVPPNDGGISLGQLIVAGAPRRA